MRSPRPASYSAITCCTRRARICCVASGPGRPPPRATRARWRWSPTTPSGASSSAGCARCDPNTPDGEADGRCSSSVRPLQLCDVELLHLEHRGHHALRFFGVLVVQHLEQDCRHDLPGHAEAVLEPTALHFLPARG